jgi:hypothetical protein
VVVGVAVVPGTPGATFGLYVTGYAVVRFWLETLRGDPVRRYWHGLSEAQWTSLAVIGAMAALAVGLGLPGRAEHVAAAGFLLICAALVAGWPASDLLDPRHVRELAHILAPPRQTALTVRQTTLNIRISAGCTNDIDHYTLSRASAPLTAREGSEMATVVSWLTGLDDPPTVVQGVADTTHLVSRVVPGSRCPPADLDLRSRAGSRRSDTATSAARAAPDRGASEADP